MDTISLLTECARRDFGLLERNKRYGDDLAKYRLVDFEMVANCESIAKRVGDFVTACNYGQPRIAVEVGEWRVYVRVSMPLVAEQLCPVSGLMAVVAAHFGLRYEGWGCTLRTI